MNGYEWIRMMVEEDVMGGTPPTDPTTKPAASTWYQFAFRLLPLGHFFFLSLNFIVVVSGTLRLLFVFFSCGVDDIDDNGGTTTVKCA